MSRIGQTRPASAPVTRPPYRAAAAAASLAEDDHRTADALIARQQCTTIAAQHHHSIVQMIRDRKREHVDVSLWAHTDPNNSSNNSAVVHSSGSTSSTAPLSLPLQHHNALRSNWMANNDSSTTALLSAPSITGLMDECRRRKLGRYKADSTKLTEVQYRERLQRSWLQGWWFLWQRCVSQLHDAGIRYAQVSRQLVEPQRRHVNRRMTLRRELSKSLESLNHMAHLAERYTVWVAFHLHTAKQRVADQHRLRGIEVGASNSCEPDVSHIREQGSLCEQHEHAEAANNDFDGRQVERRPPTPSNGPPPCNDSNQSSSPSRYRGYVVEDPWSPSQRPGRVPLTSSNPSDRSRSGLLSHLSDHEGHVVDNASNEAFAVLALESHANDLITRHGRKLCKVTSQEESVTRRHAQRTTLDFITSRNIEMAWILSADGAKHALRQHAIAAYIVMEDVLRSRLESAENSAVIDKIVEWKIEHRLLLQRLALASSRPPTHLPAATFARGVSCATETSEEEIPLSVSPALLLMGGGGLMQWAARRVQILQRTCRGYSCRMALFQCQQGGSSSCTSSPCDEQRTANLQAAGRGYLARKHCRMQLLFWQLDRRIRKETWDAFCHGLVRWAGRLASLLEEDEIAQKQDRAVRVAQSVGKAFLSRRALRPFSQLLKLESAVRNSMVLLLGKEHLALLQWNEPVQRLETLQLTAYASLCEQEAVEAQSLSGHVASTTASALSSRVTGACTLLQRVGRANCSRNSLTRLSTFWAVDTSIRKETFSAWLSKAEMMERAKSRMVIRIMEREQRAAIERLMDGSYIMLSEEYKTTHHQLPYVVVLQRIGRAHTRRCTLQRNLFFWRVDQSVRNDAMAAWLRATSTLSALCTSLAPVVDQEAQRRGTLEQRALTAFSEILAQGRGVTLTSALFLQRVARGHQVRCAAKRLIEFWRVDSSIRNEAFDAWLTNTVRMERAACRDRLRTNERLQRRQMVDNEQVSRAKLVDASKNISSIMLVQRVARGHLNRIGLERLYVFWRVDASIRRETLDAWLNATARVERAAKRDLLRIEEKFQRRQLVSSEASERHDYLAARGSSSLDARAIVVDVTPSKQSSSSCVSVSSDDDSKTMRRISVHCDHGGDSEDDVIDVSSDDNDDAAPTITGTPRPTASCNNTIVASPSDVDVSSDDENDDDGANVTRKAPNQISAAISNTRPRTPDTQQQRALRTSDSDVDVSSEDEADQRPSTHEQQSEARAHPPQEDSSDADVSSDDDCAATQRPSQVRVSMRPPVEESSDEDVDISSDDDDEAANEIQQRLQLSILKQQDDARESLIKEEFRRRATVRRYHLAEMEAIFIDGSDATGDDDGSEAISDGDRSLHFTPQANEPLTPAKSDTTHPPHSVRKQSLHRFPQQQHGNSSILARGMSTSSSVTLMKSTSGGNRDDSVEIVSVTSSSLSVEDADDDDSSIDISSSEDDGAYQRSRMVGPSNSSVRNIYMRVFADQRAKLEASEVLARRNNETELCKLQLSLLSAQEYLVRHSTLVHNRNRFARSMLETKQRLSDMARMQLHRTLSSNTRANLSSQPLPRGPFPPRSRRTLSSDSISTGGASTTGGGSPAETPLGMSPMMIRTGSSASMVFRQVAAALESESKSEASRIAGKGATSAPSGGGESVA